MPNERPAADPNAAIPPTLSHVIGQRCVVEKLRIAVEAAWADSVPLDHVMLTGPPGVGKTLLANVLAREMAGEFKEVLGQGLCSPQAVNGFLMSAERANAVMFIDEAHEASPAAQTALYKAIDERAVYLRDIYADTTTKLELPKLTLLLATTDPQRLLLPLRDRMRLVCQLSRYTTDDLVALLRQKARQLGWEIEDASLGPIAARAMGTPRLALRLLQAARRTTRAEGETVISAAHIERTFEIEEIDALGLGPDERAYLDILAETNEPVRVMVLASRLGLVPGAVTSVVETNMLWLGLISRTEQGRCLTARGIEHVRSERGELSAQIEEAE